MQIESLVTDSRERLYGTLDDRRVSTFLVRRVIINCKLVVKTRGKLKVDDLNCVYENLL